ncbi:MAG: MerR family transcriptional regulator [Lactobacillus sp.]|jgi:DNA-binding transcriptional MerR regulator|nr:MerR family transcriptional regulator [Lactobacillus sp.]
MNDVLHFSIFNDENFIFGISEASKMTKVSTRQLRYWEKRAYIKSLPKQTGEARQYSFRTLIKIIGIKYFLDEGYTLQAASKKVIQYTQNAHLLKQFVQQRFMRLTEIDGLPAIDLGSPEEHPEQKIYGVMDHGNAKIVIRPTALDA